jgi:hypothetical protein
MNTDRYLKSTTLLDYESNSLNELIKSRGWEKLNEYDRIGAAYDFVRNEISFGYNESDDLSASQVLAEGIGQCNTKGTLLMALLRALDIPCRIHGFTIDNNLQKGAIPNSIFFLSPKKILHSWVEVLYEDQWIELEGFILDEQYLNSIQRKFSQAEKSFQGYAIATSCLKSPEVNWNGKPTYIQKEGIVDDFGVFDEPDSFYSKFGTNLSGLKRILFRFFFRHVMNRNVDSIRRRR